MAIPTDPDALLTRKRMAEVLTEAGFKTSPATLATYVTRGGGPPYEKYGPFPLYRCGLGLAWARARLSRLVSSSSELEAV